MDNVYVIKVKHEGSLRRITALKSTDGALLPFSELEGRVRALFKLPASADVVLTYQDDEGDVITLATDQDLKDALVYQGLNPLRLDLAVKPAAVATAAAASAAAAPPSSPSPAPVAAAPVASPATASASSPAAGAGREDKAEKSAPPPATPETGVFKDDAAPRPSQPAATTTAGAAAAGMPKLMSIINKELEQVLGSLGSDFHVDVDFDGPAGSTTSFSSSSTSSSSSASNSEGAAAGAGQAAPSGVDVAGVPPIHKVVHVASAIDNVGGLAGIIAKEVEAALKSIDLGSAGQQGPSISTSFSTFPSSSSSSSSVGASSGEAKDGGSSSAADAGFGGLADLIKTIASTAAQTAAVAASVQAASDAAAKAASAASGASPAAGASAAAPPAGAAPCPTPAAPVRHVGIICDGCDMNPIVGPRFKSLVKEDYDLCEGCFAKSGEAAETYARMDSPQLPFPPFHHHHHHHAHHAAMHGHPHSHPHHPMHHGPAFRSPSFAHFGPRRMCPRPPSPVFFGGRPFNMRPDHHHHVQHPARCDSSPSAAPSAPAAPGSSSAAGGPSLSNHGPGCTAAASSATSAGSTGSTGVGGRAGKLDARFVRDVSVADGSEVVAGSRFCKVWRMRNSGAAAWPQDTRIVHFGGDMLGLTGSAALDLPEGGLPVDAEVDVRVDMVAPMEPGRYVSHWKLSAPGGPMFGHRVWALVHVVPLNNVSEVKTTEEAAAVLSAPKIVEIEVIEGDVAASAALQAAAEVESPVDPLVAVIMAAAPPANVTEEGGDDDRANDEEEAAASAPADSGPAAAAVEAAPVTLVPEAVPAPAAAAGAATATGVATAAGAVMGGAGSPGSPKVEDTTVGSFSLVDMPSAALAAPTGGPATSSPAAEVTAVDSFVMAHAAPADAAVAAAAAARRVIVGDADDEEEVEDEEEEEEDADEEMEMVEVPVQPDAGPAAPVEAAAVSGTPFALPRNEGGDVVLDQLEAMGFVGRDLNRELLAKTGGNLDATVELLVKAAEWEPVLEELEDMGFMDVQLNKRLLFKYDGNVRRTVKDLVQMCRSGAVVSA